MSLLAIDTSAAFVSIALRLDTDKVVSRSVKSEHSHFEQLSKLVDELFVETQINKSQIQSVLVGAGPGSFTGLRIAFGFAKGFAFGSRIPLYSVSSFAGIARRFKAVSKVPEGGTVFVVSDARREQVFLGTFKVSNQRTVLESDTQLVSYQDVSKAVGECLAESGAWAVSSDLSLPELGVPVQIVQEPALGIIDLFETDESVFNTSSLSEIQPDYVREVAAKTIAERNA